MRISDIVRPRRALHAIGSLAACASLLAPALGNAQSLSAGEIEAAVSDKTYQGSMTADRFAEYYAADGSIRGDGYTGEWRAEDDTLCFRYGEAAGDVLGRDPQRAGDDAAQGRRGGRQRHAGRREPRSGSERIPSAPCGTRVRQLRATARCTKVHAEAAHRSADPSV